MAIWHKAPTSYTLAYGEANGLDTLSVLAADPVSMQGWRAGYQSARDFLAVGVR